MTIAALIESVQYLTYEPTHSQPSGCGPHSDTHRTVSSASRSAAKPLSAFWRPGPPGTGLGR